MATSIDRDRLLELLGEGAQVVDVLPEAEYEAGHIPGAVSLPLKRLTAATAEVLSRGKPVVVY